MPEGGKKTPIDSSVIDRISGAMFGAIRGASEAWFGPLQPIAPVAPPDTAGRQWDYPVGWNLTYKPRGEQGENAIDYSTLRALADPTLGGLDLLRLAIETRKDQMLAQKWTVRPRLEEGDDTQPAEADKKLAKEARRRLQKPDGIHSFRLWQRMLIEEMLVTDATTLYIRNGENGVKIAEQLDGTTIKVLIDPSGRRPVEPQPAYEQVLHGLPAVPYTAGELIYLPHNPRVQSAYGLSQVQQVITTVCIAIRRQLSQSEYYTAGSVPDVIMGVPDSWNLDAVKQFQAWWDSIFSGNTEERRRARFVPGGVTPTILKPDSLKDEWDEWLARIICWCFSLSPQALVKAMNRATAETAQQTALEEGLEPLKLWFTDLMNDVIARIIDGGDRLEFAYQDEEITDPKTKAEVFSTATGGKAWMTQDEVRAEYGKPPLTPGQKAEVAPPPPPSNEPDGHGGNDDSGEKQNHPFEPAEKLGKKSQEVVTINRDRPSAKKSRAAIQRVCDGFFSSLKKSTKDAASGLLGAKGALDVIDGADFAELGDAIRPLIENMATDGVKMAIKQVLGKKMKKLSKNAGPATPELPELLDLANEKGIAWAEKHAAELVKGVGDTTKADIRALIAKALEEGWSNDKLADAIEESGSFSPERSEKIARTETCRADVSGNIIGWKASGVVTGKKWLVAQDEVCTICEDLNGVEVGLDEEFPDPGGDGPPDPHPGCRCDVLPILSNDDEEP